MATWYRRESGEWTMTHPLYWEGSRNWTSSIESDVNDKPHDDDFEYPDGGQGVRVRHKTINQ